MVRNFESKVDTVNHMGAGGVPDMNFPIDNRISIEFHGHINMTITDNGEELHIGEIPTKEFIAEMVKLRLKRG